MTDTPEKVKDPYWFIPVMPYWFRRLEYRFPYKFVHATVYRRPAAWLPTWIADLWIVFTNRFFVAYRGGDGRLTSRSRKALTAFVQEHRRRMETDPEYAASHRRRIEKIKRNALPIDESNT